MPHKQLSDCAVDTVYCSGNCCNTNTVTIQLQNSVLLYISDIVRLVFRRIQRTLNIPSFFDPMRNEFLAEADSFNPYSQRLCLAIDGKHAVSAHVAHLFSSRSPATICRTIWTIIVYPLKRVLWCRAHPHISNKVLERSLTCPLRAYRDPATTIVVEILARWSEAAPLHRLPYAIFGRKLNPFDFIKPSDLFNGTLGFGHPYSPEIRVFGVEARECFNPI